LVFIEQEIPGNWEHVSGPVCVRNVGQEELHVAQGTGIETRRQGVDILSSLRESNIIVKSQKLITNINEII
jgi:hypothetical protein